MTQWRSFVRDQLEDSLSTAESSKKTRVMANASFDEAIDGLKKLLSGKEELGPIAAMKIAQLTNELQASSAPYPVERMKTGFEHFKKEKYEKETQLFQYLAERQRPKVNYRIRTS